MTRKTEEPATHPKQKSLGQSPEADLPSQAWEATSQVGQTEASGRDEDELTPEQQRVNPKERRKHAISQGTDEPSIPRGRKPDTAMREDRDHPGRIDKENDC